MLKVILIINYFHIKDKNEWTSLNFLSSTFKLIKGFDCFLDRENLDYNNHSDHHHLRQSFWFQAKSAFWSGTFAKLFLFPSITTLWIGMIPPLEKSCIKWQDKSQQKKMEQSTKTVMDTIHSLIIHSVGSSYIQTLIDASGQVEIQKHNIPGVIVL